jgi:hypothetical protein
MDDGNIPCDRKFIDIMRPAGFKGTFNLCHVNSTTPEEYRELYRGFEIANHCKNHPMVFADGQEYIVSEESLDRENSKGYSPDEPFIYKTDIEGLYRFHPYKSIEKPAGWYSIADTDTYIRFIDETKRELEVVFGEGSVNAYVWPSASQNNRAVKEHLLKKGYYSVRKPGTTMGEGGFPMPDDRHSWSCTAREGNLLSAMELYEALPDDGELKFFCLGLHSHDYEGSNKWDDLKRFADTLGNRPDDFYYASNKELFEYEDAVKAVVITEREIINPSDVSLYLTVDGGRVIISPKSSISI